MTSSIADTDIVVRREEVIANELSDTELVMLDIDRGVYFGLRDVGKVIWSKLAVPTTAADLCAALMAEFDVDAVTCRQEVAAFLERLKESELIDVNPASPAP